MDKLTCSIKLACVMVELEVLMHDIIDSIGDLENEEHELQPILQLVTDIYEVYDRNIEIN